MNFILFDDNSWTNLLPLTFTKPVSEIRVGIITIKEKWEKGLDENCSYLTQDYLKDKFPQIIARDNIFINSSIIPNKILIDRIKNLNKKESLIKNDTLIASRLVEEDAINFNYEKIVIKTEIQHQDYDYLKINYPWDIFTKNGEAITSDFQLITKSRDTSILSSTNNCLEKENIFIEEGVNIEFATLNASTGPIYLGNNSEIMEGSVIRGPFALCENSTVKISAKIYGPTTIGPFSKVGGEINNSVIQGYSNKAHDGFLGNSVLGEWCNIGADSNNSNLKNNYSEIRLWNYKDKRFINTGLKFCGLIFGDHSKCGINTMFNTGTVVGVNTNIYGSGFPRNFIPSFSWGGSQGFSLYNLDKALEVAEKVMERRNKILDEKEKEIISKIYEITEQYRNF